MVVAGDNHQGIMDGRIVPAPFIFDCGAAFERLGLTPIGHDDIVRFYIGHFMRLRWTDHGKHHLP
jgi:hypothetical protein